MKVKMKKRQRLLSFLMCVMMVLCTDHAIALASNVGGVATDGLYEGGGKQFYVNPLYADSIDEDQLRAELEAIASTKPTESVNFNTNVSENEVMPRTYNAPVFTSSSDAVLYIRGQMVARENSIAFTYSGTPFPDAKGLVEAAMEDTGNGSGQEGDALRYVYAGYSVSLTTRGNVRTYNYSMKYYTTAAEESQLTAAVNAAMSSLSLSGRDEVDKIKAIHDYICQNVSYDYDHLSDNSYRWQYSAYGAMVLKKAVCQGYSALFYRMCKEAGLSVRIIPGRAETGGNSIPHAWNIVRIGSYYYNIDCTWDSQKGSVIYNYYLKSNGDFGSHVREPEYLTSEFNARYPMAPSSFVDTLRFRWAQLVTPTAQVGSAAQMQYLLNKDASVTVEVFYGNNSFLKTLASNVSVGTGTQTVSWDLRNAAGRYVANGTYRFTITAVTPNGERATLHKWFQVTGNEPLRYKWTNLGSGNVRVGNNAQLYYAVNKNARVTVQIFYGNNSYMKTLVSDRAIGTNDQVANWDLTDAGGNYVASGTYRYTIIAVNDDGEQVVAHKWFQVSGVEPLGYKWTNLGNGTVAIGNNAQLYYAVNKNARVTVQMFYGNNNYMKTLVSDRAIGTNDQVANWDLTDASGNYVSNGTYRYTITAVTDKGERTVAHKWFQVTGNEPLSYRWTNLGSGTVAVGNSAQLYYAVNKNARVTVQMFYGNNNYMKTLVSDRAIATNDQVANWDLRDAGGNYVPNGTYRYTITAVTDKGEKVVAHKWFQVVRR